MRRKKTGSTRYIEQAISRRGVSNHDELERVVRALVAIECDMELFEECLEEAEAEGIEVGSQAWSSLRRTFADYLTEDAKSAAAVLGSSAGEVLFDVWRCHAQDSDEEGRDRNTHVEATVMHLVEGMRELG